MKSDTRAILAVHTHLISHNPRISVTHNGHNTWKLRISNVQRNDSGAYMCQINTEPMESRIGYLEVLVPADILDDKTSEGLVIQEGGSVRFRCIATGIPQPTVSWKREDGRNIILREDGQKQSVKNYKGGILELAEVHRQEMGYYLCLATNGVPPIVSKRYSVRVQFKPGIKVTNQLVAAPIQSNVILQCLVEASPRALNIWHRKANDDEKLMPSEKYKITEYALNDYTWQMNLTVNSLEKKDFGEYVCSSSSALGKADGFIHLRELHLAARTTPSPFVRFTDQKPSKKKPMSKGRKKNDNSNNRRIHMGSFDDFDSSRNDDDFSTTKIMGGNTLQEGHGTEKPLVTSTPASSLANINTMNRKHHLVPIALLFPLFILTVIFVP